MRRSDYKCADGCNLVTEVTIGSRENFPESVKCHHCGGDMIRLYAPLHGIVHQGRVGNYNNGYQSSHCGISVKKT